jgi:hypothetical protein
MLYEFAEPQRRGQASRFRPHFHAAPASAADGRGGGSSSGGGVQTLPTTPGLGMGTGRGTGLNATLASDSTEGALPYPTSTMPSAAAAVRANYSPRYWAPAAAAAAAATASGGSSVSVPPSSHVPLGAASHLSSSHESEADASTELHHRRHQQQQPLEQPAGHGAPTAAATAAVPSLPADLRYDQDEELEPETAEDSDWAEDLDRSPTVSASHAVPSLL